MSDITEITASILEFRDKRDWAKFHTGKDLAISLNVESAELLEAFLWKNSDEVNVMKIREELADVFYSAFLLANYYNLDVKEIVLEKLKANEIKYPADKFLGSNKKHNEL